MSEKQIADEISNALNSYTIREENIAKILANMHPTLQQQFMNVAVHFIVEMSKKTFNDQRNNCSVEKAKRIVEKMSYEDIHGECPYI